MERIACTWTRVVGWVGVVVLASLVAASPALADGADLVFDGGRPISGQPPPADSGAPDTPADFDWDGAIDSLQLLRPDPNNVADWGWYVVFGGANPTVERFEPAWTLAASEGQTWNGDLAGYLVGDSDGDGHPDVFAANRGQEGAGLRVYGGRGPAGGARATFTLLGSYSAGVRTTAYVIDIDSDGRDDVVYGDPRVAGAQQRIAYGGSTATGTMFCGVRPAFSVDPPNGFLAAADFNGDGLADAAAVCVNPMPRLNAAARRADGTYGSPATIIGLNAIGMVGDINGDGLLDIGDGSGNWALNRTSTPPFPVPETPLAALLLAPLVACATVAAIRHNRDARRTASQ